MANPVLNSKTFTRAGAYPAAEPMTVEGAVNRTGLLLLLCLAGATYTWIHTYQAVDPSAGYTAGLVGMIAGFVAALATAWRPHWAPITAPLYALLEGLALGFISAVFATEYKGLVTEAVALTFVTLGVMLLAYRSGLVRATPRFRKIVIGATAAVFVFYLATIALSFFHVAMPLVYSSTPLGIGFSLVVVAIAAFNLVLDFDLIERGAAEGAPKFYEWYGAFALLVTIVWVYLEMLRLLAKLSRR